MDDQDGKDESEHGRMLINTRQGWRIAADHALKWKPTTLAVLFGGQKERPSRLLPEEINAESALMQALADLEEDERLDGGAMEIDSDEEFRA